MRERKNEKGFSMIELIVVVAIMAIIGAVLIPQFSTMSTRARLTTDASTVKAVQQQIDVYMADIGTTPGTMTSNVSVNGSVIDALLKNNYLDSKYLSGTSLVLQTTPAACKYDAVQKHYVLVVQEDVYKALKTNDSNKDTWIVKPNTNGVTLP